MLTDNTKCPNCKGSLTWLSHTRLWRRDEEVHEFSFRCESCKREFRFRDEKLEELKPRRDPVAEQIAIREAETTAARGRRCFQCGGPLDDFLTCEWCSKHYTMQEGELVPRIEVALRPRPKMADFYARQETQ